MGAGLVLVGHARPAWAGAAARDPYVETLVARANAKRLAEDPTWLRLGHYRKGWFGGQKSEVDGEPFFLAEDGKSNPRAELAATLRGFYGPTPNDTALEHPFCRFPARFRWLERELGLDRARLPVRSCPRFEEFMRALKPKALTLVFSSYYLNNPASAFGHTFLRVNKERPAGTHEGSELLDNGVDYAAVVDTTNALIYAVKGLSGLFPGAFKKVPFYYKVREYNDFESRDLWEYELELTHDEVTFVAAHLWELGSTYFAYYYLSENCSYQILAAVEVARPSIKLVGNVGFPVIPADTVKALFKNRGLVRDVHYRPSNRTQFRQRIEGLTPTELESVTRLMADPHAPLAKELGPAESVKIIDTAIELASLRLSRELTKEREHMDREGIELEQTLLERRVAYRVPSEEPRFAPPFRQRPELGHGSSRIGMGSGYDYESGYFHTLNFRLALHDLVDPVRGYPDGAEIDFLPGKLRYYMDRPRVTLEELSLIRVRSLTPLTRFDHSMSWEIDVGTKRLYDSGCSTCFAGFAEVGGGITWEPFGRALTLFALAKAEVAMPTDQGLWSFLRLGAGPWGGLRLRVSDDVAGLFTGSWLYLPGQHPHEAWSVDGKLRAQYLKNFAFGVEGHWFSNTQSVEALSYIYF